MGSNKYYCKIAGVVENLEDIQQMIDDKLPDTEIEQQLQQYHGMNESTSQRFMNVLRSRHYDIPANLAIALSEYNKIKREENAKKYRGAANKPKCPHCNSTNIAPIGTAERAVSVIGLGLFSKKINKSFKCKSCGYTW